VITHSALFYTEYYNKTLKPSFITSWIHQILIDFHHQIYTKVIIKDSIIIPCEITWHEYFEGSVVKLSQIFNQLFTTNLLLTVLMKIGQYLMSLWVTKTWRISLLGRPCTVVTGGLIKCSWCFSFFFFIRHAFSEFPRPIALKICHVVGIWPNFIMQVQKLGGGHSTKKSGGQKHAKFRSILDHFRLWSRISPERLNIYQIGRRYKLWQFLLRLTKKVRWTLVH